MKESDSMWDAVVDVVTFEALTAAVQDKHPEWEVSKLVTKAVCAVLDFYGIERESEEE